MTINFNKAFGTKKFEDTIEKTFDKAMKIINPSYKKLEASIIFVNAKKIREINRQYRNVDSVTDVISFPTILDADTKLIEKHLSEKMTHADIDPLTKNIILGDIYICIKRAKAQAKEFGHSMEREIAYLSLHGLLHLLGYDHKEDYDKCIMRKREEEILTALNIVRNNGAVSTTSKLGKSTPKKDSSKTVNDLKVVGVGTNNNLKEKNQYEKLIKPLNNSTDNIKNKDKKIKNKSVKIKNSPKKSEDVKNVVQKPNLQKAKIEKPTKQIKSLTKKEDTIKTSKTNSNQSKGKTK